MLGQRRRKREALLRRWCQVVASDHIWKPVGLPELQAVAASNLGDMTEARWVVGFEGILGALLAALDGGVFTSIHGGGE